MCLKQDSLYWPDSPRRWWPAAASPCPHRRWPGGRGRVWPPGPRSHSAPDARTYCRRRYSSAADDTSGAAHWSPGRRHSTGYWNSVNNKKRNFSKINITQTTAWHPEIWLAMSMDISEATSQSRTFLKKMTGSLNFSLPCPWTTRSFVVLPLGQKIP